MRDLIRGGIILSVISLFVVFIYAQTSTETVTEVAENDPQKQELRQIINKPTVIKEVNKTEIKKEAAANAENNTQTVQEKGKVEKTASVRSSRLVNKGKFIATAYCLRGKTAMGHRVRKGLIAADRRVLPLGSRVSIDGGAYSGDYLVSDTGGAIKGKRIDIWMASCAEAKRFGRRSVTVSLAQ